MKHLLSLLAVISAVLPVTAENLKLSLTDKANFGSGSVAQSSYFPGGIDTIGLIAGHANLLTRTDRILLRFDITDFYLGERMPEIKSARLEFTLWYIAGEIGDREAQVDHLAYETGTLSANDLSNPAVDTIGAAQLKLDEHPPKGDDGRYSFDVTAAVKSDLAERRQYAGFRLADSAGDLGNATGSSVGYIIQSPVTGRGANPVLVIEYQ